MPDAPSARRHVLVLLGALLVVAVVIAFRPQRAPSPRATAATDASTLADQPTTSRAAAVASPSSPAASADERHGPKKREGVDAANLYADAFVLFDRLTDEEKAMIRKPREEVDAEKAAQLFEKIQAIMALLRAAAKADYCDWGTGEITFETSLAHIGKAQNLANLALWAAAYRFATDPAGAIDDLAVRARLGHHLTDTLLGILVGAGFEAGANELLRDRMGSLDSRALNHAVDFVGHSALDADLTRGFQGEISGVEAMGKKLASMNAAERIKTLMSMGASDAGTPEPWAGAERVLSALRDSQRVAAEFAFIRGIEEKAAEAMRLPEAEFQSWWNAVEREVRGDHPLAEQLLPSISQAQRAIQERRVERALLTAGADVLQNGPAQIGRYRDPATGGALLYVPTAGGFELRSPYLVKGKPVTLSFRTATAP